MLQECTEGMKVKVKSLSRGRLFVTPWTVACQAPPSMGFSRQEYWSGCHFLLQEIVPTQGLNLGLPCCRQMLYHSRRRFLRQDNCINAKNEIEEWSKR